MHYNYSDNYLSPQKNFLILKSVCKWHPLMLTVLAVTKGVTVSRESVINDPGYCVNKSFACRLAVFGAAMVMGSVAGQPQKRMSSPSSMIMQVRKKHKISSAISIVQIANKFDPRPPSETPPSASYTTRSPPLWRSTSTSTMPTSDPCSEANAMNSNVETSK